MTSVREGFFLFIFNIWSEKEEYHLSTDNPRLPVPPSNPLGGEFLIVDAGRPECFARPSEAIAKANEHDQIIIQPGNYEDRVIVSERPIYLIGAGRDQVTIFNRRSGPCYLQRVSGGGNQRNHLSLCRK
jgi:hypothetical protein